MTDQNKQQTRVTRLHVLPPDEPMIDSQGWAVSVIRWNGREAVSVEYIDGDRVIISPEEWSELRDAIAKMIGECR